MWILAAVLDMYHFLLLLLYYHLSLWVLSSLCSGGAAGAVNMLQK